MIWDFILQYPVSLTFGTFALVVWFLKSRNNSASETQNEDQVMGDMLKKSDNKNEVVKAFYPGSKR